MSETTDAILNGEQCAECLIFFVQPHGYPVLCNHCFTSTLPYDTPYQQTTIKEGTPKGRRS